MPNNKKTVKAGKLGTINLGIILMTFVQAQHYTHGTREHISWFPDTVLRLAWTR